MRINKDAIRVALGILTLERAPRNVLFSEDMLPCLFDEAKQEYTDILAEAGIKIGPLDEFKQPVLDDIMRYLEKKEKLH